jgi:proline iminopeptidase
MTSLFRSVLALFGLLFLLSQPLHLQATALPNGTMPLTTSDGVALYVRVAGHGTPCVFVHGGPGTGSYGFEKLAGQPLEEKLQMIYVDQRGSGRSASHAQLNYSLERQVQDLEEIRQQLHLKKWVVMAHSFGGIIATAYAQKYPQHVQALILANGILNLPAAMESTVAYGYNLLPAATRPPLDSAMPLPQRYFMVSAMLQQQKLYNQLQYASDSTAARVSRLMQGQTSNHDFAANLFKAPGRYVEDFTPATASLTMPVLVLTGQQDYITGPEHYKSFHFPQQRVVVLPGRHMPFLDNPKEFNQAVQGFVRKLPRR